MQLLGEESLVKDTSANAIIIEVNRNAQNHQYLAYKNSRRTIDATVTPPFLRQPYVLEPSHTTVVRQSQPGTPSITVCRPPTITCIHPPTTTTADPSSITLNHLPTTTGYRLCFAYVPPELVTPLVLQAPRLTIPLGSRHLDASLAQSRVIVFPISLERTIWSTVRRRVDTISLVGPQCFPVSFLHPQPLLLSLWSWLWPVHWLTPPPLRCLRLMPRTYRINLRKERRQHRVHGIGELMRMCVGHETGVGVQPERTATYKQIGKRVSQCSPESQMQERAKDSLLIRFKRVLSCETFSIRNILRYFLAVRFT